MKINKSQKHMINYPIGNTTDTSADKSVEKGMEYLQKELKDRWRNEVSSIREDITIKAMKIQMNFVIIDVTDNTFKKIDEALQSEREQTNKQFELLKKCRDKLYNNLPTGNIDAFELINIIKEHIKELDNLIDKAQKGELKL